MAQPPAVHSPVAHPPVARSITWIYTHNLDDTARFYGEVLGLQLAAQQAGENGGGCRIFQQGPASYVGVCQVRPGRWVEPKGVIVSFVVPDVEAWHRHLVANGVTPEGAPRHSTAYGVTGFMAKDPNGYMLEFQTFPDLGIG